MATLAASTAGQLNLAIEQGADFDITLTWEDSTGSLVDLTGYTAWLQVRSGSGSGSTVLLDFRSYAGGTSGCAITLGDTLGTIQITATAAATTGLSWTNATYDLILTAPSPSNKVERLVEGIVTVYPAVTHS